MKLNWMKYQFTKRNKENICNSSCGFGLFHLDMICFCGITHIRFNELVKGEREGEHGIESEQCSGAHVVVPGFIKFYSDPLQLCPLPTKCMLLDDSIFKLQIFVGLCVFGAVFCVDGWLGKPP